jgi:predicted phosphodiesterase
MYNLSYLLILSLLFLFSCTDKLPQILEKTENVKLCFIGDVGEKNPVQERVAKALEQESCDSLFFLGDLVYPDGIVSLQDPQLKKNFLDTFETQTKKGYLILGNHDYRGLPHTWLEVSRQYPQFIFPHFYYFLRSSEFCIVALDTNLFKIVSFWPEAIHQWLWLRSIKEDLKTCKTKIAITHHPYHSRGSHHGPSTGLLKWFFELSVLGDFDFLISGHEHILSDEGVFSGTHQYVSGGGSTPDKNEAPGFLIMEYKTTDAPVLTLRKID